MMPSIAGQTAPAVRFLAEQFEGLLKTLDLRFRLAKMRLEGAGARG